MKLRMAYAAALAIALAACNKVDNEDMAKKIKDWANDQLSKSGAKVTVKGVDCPSGQSIKEGTKFDCKVSFDNSVTIPAHVEMQADQKFKFSFDPDDLAKVDTGGGEEEDK